MILILTRIAYNISQFNQKEKTIELINPIKIKDKDRDGALMTTSSVPKKPQVWQKIADTRL
jgi:hypothetical protein